MRKITTAVLLSIALVLGILCFAWPGVAASAALMSADAWADAGLSTRRAGLIWRGVWVPGVGALLAQIIGAALAVGLVKARSTRVFRASAWISLTILLTPPYIYAYTWSLVVLPEGIANAGSLASPLTSFLSTTARAVWCLATWTAPVAAFVLSAGWRLHGRAAYELGRLDAGGPQSFRRVVVPLLWPWIAISMLATFLLASNEFSVCHLCMVQTWNTEILAAMQLFDVPGRGLALAWPLIVLSLLTAIPLIALRRRISAGLDAASRLEPSAGRSTAGSIWTWIAIALLCLPWLIFAMHIRNPGAFVRTFKTYPHEWPTTLLAAAGSVGISAILAVAVDYVLAFPRIGRGFPCDQSAAEAFSPSARQGGTGEDVQSRLVVAAGYGGYRKPQPHFATRLAISAVRGMAVAIVLAAAVAALLPASLIGDAFNAAYLAYPADHWPIVPLVAAARFAIIAIVAMRLAGAGAHPQFAQMAAADGATYFETYFRVRLPHCLPALTLALVAVGLLSLTEVAATILVRPMNNLAVTMLNAIHFGRDDQVVAMSLYLMIVVATSVATCCAASLRRRSGADR